MPRAGLSAGAVVAAAVAVVDESGESALTLAAVAQRVGVKAPSLYKHVDGLPALRSAVAVTSKQELASDLERTASGRAGADAIRALAAAYRAWALAHPGRYPLTVVAADPDDRADVGASQRLYDVVAAALRGYSLDDAHEVDAIRALRAVLHGFVGLENAGGFGLPDDVDRSFGRAVDAVIATLDA